MSLNARLLELLTTPAARAASDEDTRRAVERALGVAHAPMKRPRSIALDFDGTIFGGKFTDSDEVDGPPVPGAIAWLSTQLAAGVNITIHTCRLTPINPDCPWPTVHEQSAVRAAISVWLQRHIGAAAVEQLRWWTHPGKPHCDIYLDDKAVRFDGVFPTFDDTDRPCALTERVANLEHTLDVIAQCAAAGDLDGVRMHYQHARGPAPDLSVDGGARA